MIKTDFGNWLERSTDGSLSVPLTLSVSGKNTYKLLRNQFWFVDIDFIDIDFVDIDFGKDRIKPILFSSLPSSFTEI